MADQSSIINEAFYSGVISNAVGGIVAAAVIWSFVNAWAAGKAAVKQQIVLAKSPNPLARLRKKTPLTGREKWEVVNADFRQTMRLFFAALGLSHIVLMASLDLYLTQPLSKHLWCWFQVAGSVWLVWWVFKGDWKTCSEKSGIKVPWGYVLSVKASRLVWLSMVPEIIGYMIYTSYINPNLVKVHEEITVTPQLLRSYEEKESHRKKYEEEISWRKKHGLPVSDPTTKPQ